MSILSNNPTDITTGVMWSILVHNAVRKDIYNVLDSIAMDVEKIGSKMNEGKPARSKYCYLAIGKPRWGGKRICELQLQAPSPDNDSGWTPFQVISLELRGEQYCFRYDTCFKPSIKNDESCRAFTDIYKIPVELFYDLKDVIDRGL